MMQSIKEAARSGNAPALCMLGLCYADGCGLKRDPARAADWFRIAGEKGHVNALFNYAVMLYKGDGILKDQDAAVQLFRQAAEAGHAEARKLMGME